MVAITIEHDHVVSSQLLKHLCKKVSLIRIVKTNKTGVSTHRSINVNNHNQKKITLQNFILSQFLIFCCVYYVN